MNKLKPNLHFLIQLISRLGIVTIIFLLIKVLFYWFNASLFSVTSILSFIKTLFFSIRFDWVSIIYINSIFILLSILPFQIRDRKWYQKIQLFFFLTFNSIAIIFELIDIGFFKFTLRRTIGSDLNLFKNTSEMIPGFLKEYWYLPVIFFFLATCLFIGFRKTNRSIQVTTYNQKIQVLLFFSSALVFGIIARGGLQLRPLMPISAFQYVSDSRLAPLINNTSMSLLFSVQQHFLKERNYFSKQEQSKFFNTKRQYHKDTEMDKKNVFIIVLESFGKEHISFYHPEQETTPFLDSLIKKSYYLENSYANGLRSTQGIVSISSGVPSMMQSPLMFSAYQSNRIDGLGELLGNRGYTTSFFHGANPGSMAFERFSKLSGFQHYYDRIDYNKDQYYDGQWGIWDAPFFEYTVDLTNQMEEPFFNLLFSLTSHHPYKVPKWFEQQYPAMESLQRSIRYTDYSLEQFFKIAKKMPWYQNTIFVITADHIGKSSNKAYQTKEGIYRIPILFFDPNQEITGKETGIAQQIDIMPTILDFLKYDQPFKAYGESMLDSLRSNISFNFNNDIYQLQDDEYLVLFDNEKVIGTYRYKADPFLEKNLMNAPASKALEDILKAIIQRYHYEMINNALYYKTEN